MADEIFLGFESKVVIADAMDWYEHDEMLHLKSEQFLGAFSHWLTTFW